MRNRPSVTGRTIKNRIKRKAIWIWHEEFLHTVQEEIETISITAFQWLNPLNEINSFSQIGMANSKFCKHEKMVRGQRSGSEVKMKLCGRANSKEEAGV